MITPELREAFVFFREHAGYCTPPGPAACALRLARAELWGRERGVEVTWEYEDECYEDVYGEPPPEDCEVLRAFVKHDGHVLASLGMIALASPSFIHGVARDPYVRVVNAELLAEARAALEQIEAAHAPAEQAAKAKDDALWIAQQIAAELWHPDREVGSADFVEYVYGLLDGAGFIVEAKVGALARRGFRVERDGDLFTVTGPWFYGTGVGAGILDDAIRSRPHEDEPKASAPARAALKCEIDTPEMGCRVADAFAAADVGLSDDCDHRGAEPAFEHGRWGVHCPGCGGKWSVHDAVGNDAVDGFTFEQVSEGES